MIRACDTGRDPTGSRPAVTPQHTPTSGISGKNSPNTPPPSAFPRKNSPSTPENADLGPFFVRWANFFALAPSPGQAGRTFSRTGHGHVPTLKPITPLQPLMQASMKPSAPLLAPQKATIDTSNTTATEKCTKNAHFAPTKATTVSIEARPAPAKATGVSDNRPSWPTGPGCGTRGRRRGLAGRPVGSRRYKRRQTTTIPIASRGPLLQTSSI